MLASKESRLRAGEWRNYFFLSELKTLANQFTADTMVSAVTTPVTTAVVTGGDVNLVQIGPVDDIYIFYFILSSINPS